jgi:pyruvate dehydrogenase E2 component (dihydrolipoamide acetyltransferase)
MAIPVVMPRLGWNMEVGTVVEWLKQDGDPVHAGDMLLLVESDKATTEVESLDSGILRFPADAPAVGEEVPVGGVLAFLVADGEAAPSARGNGHIPQAAPAEVVAAAQTSSAPVPPAPVVSPSATRGSEPPAASPRAIRIAAELGVDWTVLTGTGMGGRIVERDIRAAAEQAAAAAAPVAAPLPPPVVRLAAADETASPLTTTRRTIGERMVASMRTVAPVTLTTEVDATDLVRLRTDIAAALAGTETPIPTYTDLIARLVAVALGEFPDLNASLDGDRMVRHAAVHLGVAVDTERGLLVPVIRDAQTKSVQAIATESAWLIAAARTGTAKRDDLTGGTFTISNLGMYGIDAFTPIINLPECAILGVGRIVAKPVVVDEVAETISVRKMLALSLTFDHRVVDGAPAARFLQRIKQFVERPVLWLTR